LTNLKLVDLVPSPLNPRKHFDKKKLEEMAETIKEVGVEQAIVVRPKGKKYEIVLGERRFRASKIAKVHKILAVVKEEVSDRDVLLMQLIENSQREDLTPLEEATQAKALMDVGMTETEIGKAVGKSQPWVSDRIRLLGLPKELHQHITRGILGPSHAEEILRLKTKKDQVAIAKELERKEWDNESGKWKKVFKPTVRATKTAVDRFLEGQEAEEAFLKVLKGAKVKKCPECGQKAKRLSEDFGRKKVLNCSEFYYETGHNWHPKTGEIMKTPDEIGRERRREAEAKERAEKRKGRIPKGEKHVPTLPAWMFSPATEAEWAKGLLESVAGDIRQLFLSDNGLLVQFSKDDTFAGQRIALWPLDITDGAGQDYKTKIVIGQYRSTPSQEDNIARGKQDVAAVEAVIKELLKFQKKQLGHKQTRKQVMIKEHDGIKLGSKIKVSKDYTIKSYGGAGAEVVGFDGRGGAVLNYSKARKLIETGKLEVVESTSKKG
jgi:ParB/RepB/Spo0J family partition protein